MAKTGVTSTLSGDLSFGVAYDKMGNPYSTTAEILWSKAQKQGYLFIEEVYNELTQNNKNESGRGSPVDTGLLRHSWRYGLKPTAIQTGRSSGTDRGRKYAKPEKASWTKLNRWKWKKNQPNYFVWNMQPYTGIVNDMNQHTNFIEQAVAIGESKAKVRMSK